MLAGTIIQSWEGLVFFLLILIAGLLAVLQDLTRD